MKQSIIIGIDFDGTCVEHQFFKIGKEVPHAVRVMNRLTDEGHRIILWTMRSNMQPHQHANGTFNSGITCLHAAVNWFIVRKIPLFGINENPDQNWSDSHKQYCNFYIDDAAIGCPLIYPEEYKAINQDHNAAHTRPYVDWLKVEQLLEDQGILSIVTDCKSAKK